jgi:hypothetical protein
MQLHDIFEARQAALYHFMPHAKTVAVFESNTMDAQWKHLLKGERVAGNSFTRNPHLNWHGTNIRLTVDQQRIAMTNKIIPLDGERAFMASIGSTNKTSRDRVMNSHIRPKGADWVQVQLYEEYVVGPIKNLNRCITEIRFFMNSDHILRGSWSVELAEVVQAYGTKYNIPVVITPEAAKYVQDTLGDWNTPDDEK